MREINYVDKAYNYYKKLLIQVCNINLAVEEREYLIFTVKSISGEEFEHFGKSSRIIC
jgi:hypothetical protein